MLRIVDSTNRRAVRALLSPERLSDAATDRRVAKIVERRPQGGRRGAVALCAHVDRLDGPIEVSRAEMRRGAATVPRAVRAAIRDGGPQHPHRGQAAGAAGWRVRSRLASPSSSA